MPNPGGLLMMVPLAAVAPMASVVSALPTRLLVRHCLSADERTAAQGTRAGSLPRLTPDAAPETVLGWARIFARRYAPFGSLDCDDLASEACLRFYTVVVPRWRLQIGDFGAYAVTHMRRAMLEAQRREARIHSGWVRPAGGPSATPRPVQRRPGSRARHNRDYYVRHVGLQMCDGCGAPVGRGHGARRCDACVRPAVLADRQRRAQRRLRVA